MNKRIEETGAQSPNDPKLSDGGARRAGCGDMAGAGWAKVAGWSAAASVTRGAVRCSAWLGVADVGLERSILFLVEDVENPVEVAELCSAGLCELV